MKNIELTNFDAVTIEKATYIEEQANKLLDFTMESRSILARKLTQPLTGYLRSSLDRQGMR